MKAQSELPTNVDAERFVLGSILLDSTAYVRVAGQIEINDFSLEKHRRIFRRMAELNKRGEHIDRVTIANELMKLGELESCDGLSYLVSLDDGLPQLPNIDSYVRLVRDAAVLRGIIYASQHTINTCMMGESTPDEILANVRNSFLELASAREQTTLETPDSIVQQAGGMTAYLNRSEYGRGVQTGFSKFDTLTGGFKAGNFYVLGARPGMGKTAWFLNMADNISVRHELSTLIFSLEMEKTALLDRLVCSRARVNTKTFECGYLNSKQMNRAAQALGQITESNRIRIDDKASTDMAEIHSKIRREQAHRPVDLVVIDYLQLLIGGEVRYRVGEASKVSRDMKLVAKDCKVPLLALSQLNRECDNRSDHRPILADLRESGSIEQDADLVAFLFREEVYNRDREDLRGVAELIVAKQRNGPIGIIPLVWLAEMVRFENAFTGDSE